MYMLKLLNSRIVTTYRILCCRSSISKSDIFSVLLAMSKKSVNFCTRANISVDNCNLEVIGSGAEGVPASVLINTNYGSYLINCGEGTCKLANEYKMKIHRNPNVFITYPSWKNISGLMSVALAMQESGGTEMVIHSDPVVEDMFSAACKFVKLRRLHVRVQNCIKHEHFEDDIISAKYVFLYSTPFRQRSLSNSSLQSKNDSESESYASEISNTYKKSERERSLSVKKYEKKGSHSESENQYLNYAVCYIFKTKGSIGTLNLEKCLDYGVPPGPLLGELKNGKDITLSDGRVIKSSDVKEPDLPGVNIIAVECPTEEYLDCLLEEKSFLQYQSGTDAADAVVHFSSSDVIKNSKYQEWINQFPNKTLHLLLNEENKQTGSVAIHRQQYKLNLLQPELFPLLHDSGIPHYPRTESSYIESGHMLVSQDVPVSSYPRIYSDKIFFKCESKTLIHGETLCQLHLKPRRHYDYSKSIVLKKEEFFNEMFENEEIKQKIEEGKEALEALEQKIKSDGRIYPKVVFLGTGSSKPSKVRNASGILIYLSSSKCILLDCGEYTFGQMLHFYGKQKTREILRNLEAVYISHMHVDHHIGLIMLLKERKLAFDELTENQSSEYGESSANKKRKNFSPVFILSPPQMGNWLTTFSQNFEDISGLYDLISNYSVLANNRKPNQKADTCKEILDVDILTVPVMHCPNAFGVALIHKDGWKITYSGDTKPCESLINLGMNSDILIHEATLEDAYEAEARMKSHSTTSQAINVGKRMKAKYILLTHFSQRYCHLPNVGSLFSNVNVGIAFDFMEVPFNKLPLLPVLIKPLQYAFSKYDEKNKTSTELLLLRREKIKQGKGNMTRLTDATVTPAKIRKINQ